MEKKKWYLSKGVGATVSAVVILTVAFLADNAVNLITPALSLALIKFLGGLSIALGVASSVDKNRKPLG